MALTGPDPICHDQVRMLTTTQVAKRLGIAPKTLSRYIAAGKVPSPSVVQFGEFRVHSWTEAEVSRLKKLLPKIANGRKTRYQKLREKEKGASAGVPVPRKKRSTKRETQPRAAALPKKRKPKEK